jgi:hypothetical protein
MRSVKLDTNKWSQFSLLRSLSSEIVERGQAAQARPQEHAPASPPGTPALIGAYEDLLGSEGGGAAAEGP